MKISQNFLVGASHSPSPNHGGQINPLFIVMHYTASWEAAGSITRLCSPASQVSAHVVIDQEGSITQLVPFTTKAWHAGPSAHEGYNGLNNCSIGFEYVNIGYLKRASDGTLIDASGGRHTEGQGRLRNVRLIESKHPRVGSGTYYWPAYTEDQLAAGEELTKALIKEYNILGIVSHEEIDTRGWKTDPGPAFPMARFRNLLPNRADDSVRYLVTASSLNHRGGPGTEFSVNGSSIRNEMVTMLDRKGDWVKIDSDSWVNINFLKLAYE
jgi:N-acetylmuramoyl-L-alanine amidase